MNNLKKILLVRLSSFGDIVLTFPLLSKIKKYNPNSEIHFIVKDKFSRILKLNPFVDRIIIFEKSDIKTHRQNFKNENYELILDLHKNIRSWLLTIFLGLKVKRYKKESLKKILFVFFRINLLKKSVPVYGKYLNALFEKDFPEFSTSDLVSESKIKFDKPYILLAPSSKHFTKIYPKEKFTEFINKNANKKFIIIGDSSGRDKDICDFIADNCKNVKNLCGKTNFEDLLVLINNSEYVICNDSGILHLAEAAGKKVFAVFGSTTKELGFYPQLKSTVIFENKNLKCRPCHHIGRSSCPKKHFKCMNEIELNIES